MIRKDTPQILESISCLPVELAITTNGVLLHDFLSLFEKIGLNSINISLDTLHAEKFGLITRRAVFNQVRKNIEAAVAKQFRVKVNVVVKRGMNEMEINDFVEWTSELPLHVRFIEFMPFCGNRWNLEKTVSFKEIIERITSVYPVEKLEDEPHNTAKAFRVPGYEGTFAVISTITAPFCTDCNRIRITADGKLRNCLFATNEMDLLTPLKEGKDISTLIEGEIIRKAAQIGGLPHFDQPENLLAQLSERSMVNIGG